MGEGTSQPADQPTRPRAAQGSSGTGRKRAQQAIPASLPAQEAAAPLAAQATTGSAAPQAIPAPEVSAPPASDEPPIGERWGEFPPPARQSKLAQLLRAWDQELDHGSRSGPFDGVKLTGADVFWLRAWSLGQGDVAMGNAVLLGKLEDYEYPDDSDLNLQQAILYKAPLQRADLSCAQLRGANLGFAQLQGAILALAHMQEVILGEAQLQGASLRQAHLQGAILFNAQLQGADLTQANVQGANLARTQLSGTTLSEGHLCGVNLTEAVFDANTTLAAVVLDDHIRVADVRWNGVALTHIHWDQVTRLGDEAHAHQSKGAEQQEHVQSRRRNNYQSAVRAYRQLALELRGQGIIEAADRFTYRAHVLQRELLWLEIGLPMPGFKHRLAWLKDQSLLSLWQQRKQLHLGHAWKGASKWFVEQRQRIWHVLRSRHHSWNPHITQRPIWQVALVFLLMCLMIGVSVAHWWNGLVALLFLALLALGLWQPRRRKVFAYLFSAFLALLTGYGFRMSRIVLAYILLILAFAAAYWSLDLHRQPQPFSYWQAIILSVTAFHG